MDKKSDKLTPRQAEVLGCIQRHLEETGYPPTRAEIASSLGFKSPNAAEEHLRALARKGAIEMTPGTSRGLRLPAQPDTGLPIVGRVAAGSPILAEEHIEDHCEVPPSLFKPAADYLLRVQGDSMTGAGILDGDLLAVHKAQTASAGDLVVARVDGEATVKRFRQGGAQHLVALLPENPDYAPIEVDLRTQDFAIEGLGVGLLRRH